MCGYGLLPAPYRETCVRNFMLYVVINFMGQSSSLEATTVLLRFRHSI